jgi:hypothetical protein
MFATVLSWGLRMGPNSPDISGEGITTEERTQSQIDKLTTLSAAWLPLLADCTGEELLAAVASHAQVSPWFPTPADIRAQVPRLKLGGLQLETADPVKGRDRWPEIVRTAGSLGRSCPDWPERLATRIGVKDAARLQRSIEDAGGWRSVCGAMGDWDRQAMGKRFAASWDRQARAAAAGLLPGGPGRVLEGDRSDERDEGGPIDLLAEIARRKRLGGDRG